MKKLWFLVLIALDVVAQSGDDLIPVKQGNEWAFINTKGKTVIPHQYKNAGFFSDGLAAVRIVGCFGYIDANGTLKIPAIYDFGSQFNEGIATVVLEGKPMIIDRNGRVLFKPKKNRKFSYEGNNHLVVRNKKRTGLYHLKGSTILKPVYRGIEPMSDSVFLVIKTVGEKSKSSLYHLAKGFILPFGVYKDYHLNANGTISYVHRQNDSDTYMVIDQSGRVIMRVEDQDNMYPGKEYAQGYVILNHYGENNHHENFVDAQGNTLFKAMELERARPFSEGRAFVKFKGKEWQLIDPKGKLVSDSEYTYVNERFEKVGEKGTPVCLVRNRLGWGVIDTAGRQLVPCAFESLEISDPKRGYLLATREDKKRDSTNSIKRLEGIFKIAGHNGDDSLKNMAQNIPPITKDKDLEDLFAYDDPKDMFGLLDLSGKEILPFRYRDLYSIGIPDVFYFENDSTSGLLEINNGVIYSFNTQTQKKDLDTIDVDYMERGYCYAASAFDIYTNLGGHGSSSNQPRIGASQFPRHYQGLFLWIDTISVDTFYKRFAGHPLYLVNRSNDTVTLDAQDGRLYITMQAYHNGEWKDIEYSPSSWCGNSYHSVGLLQGQYWKFTTPVYKGSMPVKLRFQLVGQKKWNSGKRKSIPTNIVYSNTFYGSVNPAQFWKKKGHNPTGIMDPYNE